VTRSAAFVAAYVFGFAFWAEVIKRTPVLKSLSVPMSNTLGGYLSALSIAIQVPAKRIDINYFMLPKTLESLWLMLKNRGLVTEFKGLTAIMFIIAVAIIAGKFADESDPDLVSKRKSFGGFQLKVV